MKRHGTILLGLAAVVLLAPAARASLAVSTSAFSQTGEGGYGSAIINTNGGFAYFGSSTSYTLTSSTNTNITPVTLSPLGVNPGITSFSQVTNLSAAALDSGTYFGYFVSSQAPSAIEELNTVNGGYAVPISSMSLPAGQNWVGTAVVDSINHIAYLGTGTSPSMVVKVLLPNGGSVTNMTYVSSITLPAGLDFLSASAIDSSNGFAYFASSTTPGAVAKISLSDFALNGTLTFSSGAGAVASAVIDTTKQYAYFGTHDSPGKVVKVSLSSLSQVLTVTLPTGENDLTSAVLDGTGEFAYFGTNTSPGIIARLITTNLSQNNSLTLAAGQNSLRSAVIDTVNSYAYFGTYTAHGQVLQVDLLAGPPEIQMQPRNSIIHAGDTAAFYITATGRNLTYQWQRNGVPIPGATSASYSFTSATTDDGALFNCLLTDVNGTTLSQSALLTILPVIIVYPNPWRSDLHSGMNITFKGLLPNSTVKIFNVAAHWVKTLPLASGIATWDRTNDRGQAVASGYYFYLITTGNSNQNVNGELAIIK
jgi:hypothetical protein